MPDPTAHADDMKSPAVIEPNTSPAFWWVNPWGYALGLKRALDAVHLLSDTTEDAYQAAKTVIKQKEELADYHRNNLNTFQRKVELTLKPACPHLYEDTIGYVQWAADEIKRLKAGLSVMTEDRDEYIYKLDRERGTHEATLGYVRQLEEKVNHLEAKWPRDLWHGGKIYGDVYTCQPHSKTHNEKQQLIDERDNYKAANESLKADLDRAVAQRDSLLARKPAEFSSDYAQIFGMDAIVYDPRMTKPKRKPAKKKAKKKGGRK